MSCNCGRKQGQEAASNRQSEDCGLKHPPGPLLARLQRRRPPQA